VWTAHPALVAAALEAAAAVAPGRLFPAYIATGSAFLDTAGKARFIAEALGDLEADIGGAPRRPDLIEMEGSAVMQVAAANRVPALAIRAVSDALAGDAVEDFHAFIGRAAERYAGVVEAVLARIAAGAVG
jgi:nucleoside phosphorylase